ncbi:MAG: hypothetical protein ABSG61_00685 [Gemmatimonadales bacterium]|jgi:hypothetical protein
MRFPALLLSSLLALSAAGCAKSPPQTRPTAGIDYYFTATPERVWNVLLSVYSDLQIPITTMDKASWSLRTRSWILSWWQARDWTNCNALEDVTLNVTTLLLPRGDSTVMRLNVEATHWVRPNMRVGEQPPSNCNLIPSGGYPGSGVFEQEIIAAVRQRL